MKKVPKKEIKGIQIRKKEVKPSLFIDLYWENPKESTKKLLEPIYKLSKIAGSKINVQKSIYYILKMNNWILRFKTLFTMILKA